MEERDGKRTRGGGSELSGKPGKGGGEGRWAGHLYLDVRAGPEAAHGGHHGRHGPAVEGELAVRLAPAHDHGRLARRGRGGLGPRHQAHGLTRTRA